MHCHNVIACLLLLCRIFCVCQLDVTPPATDQYSEVRPSIRYVTVCGSMFTVTEDDSVSCGDDICRCDYDTADCTGVFDEQSYVPAFPEGISSLEFVDNDLSAIRCDQKNFFSNVTGIDYLDLSRNGLSFICPGSFSSLVNLTHLVLQKNNFTYIDLVPVLSLYNLTILDLSENPLGNIPDHLFHNYTMPHLQALCMMDVGLTNLNMSVFTPLAELEVLFLSRSYLSEKTLAPAFLPQLDILVLRESSFRRMFRTCDENRLSFFPNLTYLDLSHTLISIADIPSSAVCAPRLEYLHLKKTSVDFVPTNAFSDHLFPALLVVSLSHVEKYDLLVMERYAFNNSRLLAIGLVGAVDFGDEDVHPDCFAGCPNLRALTLDESDFDGVSQQKLLRLFNNNHLELLSLTGCSIASIKPEMFINLPNLTHIYLDSNKITAVPDGVFDGLRLELLDLSSNHISLIRESTFSTATQKHVANLNLGNNPFQCDCDLKWFQHWLTSRPDVFAYDSPLYICNNLPNTTVQSFFVADQACLWSPAVSKFIIASILLLLLPLLAGVMFYRYRWHIRMLMYEATRSSGDRSRRLQHQNFRYDVFVSYDSKDLHWVQHCLMAELEGRQRLRLCIHQRNFTPGAPIVENIEESVQTSKTIMLLFSRNFARSHWCQFELQLCLTHVLKHGDTLLVVLLEDIPSRDLTPAMMAVMKTMTYIEWGEGPDARASFWGRIRLALSGILGDRHNVQSMGFTCL